MRDANSVLRARIGRFINFQIKLSGESECIVHRIVQDVAQEIAYVPTYMYMCVWCWSYAGIGAAKPSICMQVESMRICVGRYLADILPFRDPTPQSLTHTGNTCRRSHRITHKAIETLEMQISVCECVRAYICKNCHVQFA